MTPTIQVELLKRSNIGYPQRTSSTMTILRGGVIDWRALANGHIRSMSSQTGSALVLTHEPQARARSLQYWSLARQAVANLFLLPTCTIILQNVFEMRTGLLMMPLAVPDLQRRRTAKITQLPRIKRCCTFQCRSHLSLRL